MHIRIREKEVFSTILEICPFYRRTWEIYRRTWEKHLEHYEEELLYVAVPDVLNRCIDLHENNKEEKIVLVFEAIEKLLVEGDKDVKELIKISVIEDFRHIFGNRFEEFIKYLKPNSLKLWKTMPERPIDKTP